MTSTPGLVKSQSAFRSVETSFITERFSLDQVHRKEDQAGRLQFNESFKSLKVVKVIGGTTESKLFINYPNDKGDGVEINQGLILNFDDPVQGCVIENLVAETGVELQIQFGKNSHQYPGDTSIELGGQTTLVGGSNFEQGLFSTITSTAAVLFAADSQRTYKIENRGAVSVYIGTQANCNDADFKNKCEVLEPGDEGFWDVAAGAYAVTESSDNSLLYFFKSTF
jgi:hypothetical protein